MFVSPGHCAVRVDQMFVLPRRHNVVSGHAFTRRMAADCGKKQRAASSSNLLCVDSSSESSDVATYMNDVVGINIHRNGLQHYDRWRCRLS